jgi:biopolymer transport protein ExbD
MMKGEDIIVPELAQILDDRRKGTEHIAKNSTNITFKGEVLIEADRKIQFKALQRIMYTCGQAGFSNFSLLVLKKES